VRCNAGPALPDEVDRQQRQYEQAGVPEVERLVTTVRPKTEFARAHSDRLWKQLVIGPGAAEGSAPTRHTGMLVVLGLAVAAALAIKLRG
jgi:hypothetical protein